MVSMIFRHLVRLYICHTIHCCRIPHCHHLFSFTLGKSVTQQKRNVSFWLPTFTSFFHQHNVPTKWKPSFTMAITTSKPEEFCIKQRIITVISFLTLVLCSIGKDIRLVINRSCQWLTFPLINHYSDLPRKGIVFNIPTFLCHVALHVIVKITINNKVFFTVFHITLVH